MKAALLRELRRPLVIADVPDPQLGPHEALVETHACGVCRTDLHIQDGLAYVPSLPHVPGHEPAGVVVEVGTDVRGVQVGQRVVPHLFVRARQCGYTRSGSHAQAMHLSGIIGVTLPGGFAEYFKAPAENLLRLPDNVPFDVGGLTSCAIITAVHAWRRSRLQSGDAAVVLGAGGIGLVLIQILKAARVRSVAIDRSQQSLALAGEAGADLSLSAGDSRLAERVRRFAGGDGDGADCVFEMVGLADTMKLAAQCVRRCGRIVVVGEEPEYPAIDSIQIAQRELEIVGSRNGGMQDATDALQMLSDGVIRPMLAGHYPLEELNAALDCVRAGTAHGRVVVRLRQ